MIESDVLCENSPGTDIETRSFYSLFYSSPSVITHFSASCNFVSFSSLWKQKVHLLKYSTAVILLDSHLFKIMF